MRWFLGALTGVVFLSCTQVVWAFSSDTVPPAVESFVSPQAGEVTGEVLVSVVASDNIWNQHGVKHVFFMVNDRSFDAIRIFNKLKWRYEWEARIDTTAFPNGPLEIHAFAIDLNDNQSDGESLKVQVRNDQQAPTISISSPKTNDNVTGIVKVQVSATDNVGVLKVEFMVNGDLEFTDYDAPYEFNLDSSVYAGQPRTVIAARAVDTSGLSADTSIAVFVQDVRLPMVSIISPHNGETVSGDVIVSIHIENGENVNQVDLLINDEVAASSTRSPYQFTWVSTQSDNEQYQLKAVAHFTNEQVVSSDVITVTVQNADPYEGRIKEYEEYLLKYLNTPNNGLKDPETNQPRTPHQYFLDEADSGGEDSHKYYNLQFAMDGLLSMFEATDNRDFIEKCLIYSEHMKSTSRVLADPRSQWDDGLRDWIGIHDYKEVINGQTVIRDIPNELDEFQVGTAMARTAHLILQSSELSDLHPRALAIANFVRDHIYYKWLDSRKRRNFTLNTHRSTGIWSDKQTHNARMAWFLGQIYGNNGMLDYARAVVLQFPQHINDTMTATRNDGTLIWDIADVNGNGKIDVLEQDKHWHAAPDTTHRNREAKMVVEFFDRGVFDRDLLDGFVATFVKRIWNGKNTWTSSPDRFNSIWFHNYIDGWDGLYRDYCFGSPSQEDDEDGDGIKCDIDEDDDWYGMNGHIYDGWVMLGQFDSRVYEIGDALFRFILAYDNLNINAIRQRNGSVYGRCALAGDLARDLKLRNFLDVT